MSGSVPDFRCAARPARRSSNSRTFSTPANVSGANYLQYCNGNRNSPILDRNLRAGLRLLGGAKGPQDQRPSGARAAAPFPFDRRSGVFFPFRPAFPRFSLTRAFTILPIKA